MIIYPAIDIKGGKCVRLVQGRFDDETVYSDDPVEVALKWERHGAQYLHVVDLDGARTGEPRNARTISEIASRVSIPVQTGGGIRSIDKVEAALSNGIKRVILGTSAIKDQELVKALLEKYGDRIVIGIDARDGMVAIEGWERTSGFTAVEFARKMQSLGAKTIIYTDISRDGMLSGPNLKAMEEMVRAVDIDVIASGGVGRIDDIRNLKNTGVSGVIIGKALYTGNVDLKQALEIAK
ncbi:MAG TPA: 1-(5-phosphoribosyl)-5-[(5-phosphoribosylamino)methylideneamino]imidazole-4-carboxamide isomerase [Clostridiaceae bacterium]|nr:1-(5-phosphoribosyl)-5-[(5-phosphoribosylamino)methylideneamino]imidazole-4-carboxamide isomerase [Clostridiaceae bacterium]